MVCAAETERGRRWAESKLKQLTGGNRVRARFMRCDEFEFEPTWKLILYGNYKPGLRGVTESVRRRFHIIPFDVIIPPEERDVDLKTKLAEEWSSILQWFIEGCLAWQSIGLADPDSVQNATQEYLSAQDLGRQWFEECCVLDRKSFTPSVELYQSYKQWVERIGERPQDNRTFLDELLGHDGLTPDRMRVKGKLARGVVGVRLTGAET